MASVEAIQEAKLATYGVHTKVPLLRIPPNMRIRQGFAMSFDSFNPRPQSQSFQGPPRTHSSAIYACNHIWSIHFSFHGSRKPLSLELRPTEIISKLFSRVPALVQGDGVLLLAGHDHLQTADELVLRPHTQFERMSARAR